MKQPIAERIINFSVKHRLAIILLTLLVSLFFFLQTLKIEINPDVASLIPPEEDVTQYIREYGLEEQVNYETLLLALFSDRVRSFDLGELALFYEVIQDLKRLPRVINTIEPFSLITFQAQGRRLEPVPMSPQGKPPATEEDRILFFKNLEVTPYAENLVISKDGKALMAIFQIERAEDYKNFMEEVEIHVSKLEGKIPYALSGSVPFLNKTTEYLSGDLSKLLLLVAGIILLLYYLGFRSLRAVFLPFLIIALGTLWSLGFMAFFGFSLTVISIVTPPLVLSLGSSYCIHLLNQYYRENPGFTKDSGWITEATTHINKTIIFASATTIAGFLSLMATSIRQTRIFALSTSFGILACALLSLFLLPAILSFLPPPTLKQTSRIKEGIISKSMSVLSRFIIHYNLYILLFLAVILITFLATLGKVTFNTDTISYFPKREPVVQDMHKITRAFGGFDEVYITLEVPPEEENFFLQPENIQNLIKLEEQIFSIPDVSYSLSFPSLLDYLNKLTSSSTQTPLTKGSALLLSRYLGILNTSSASGSYFKSLVSEDHNRIILKLRVYNSEENRFMDEQRMRDVAEEITKILETETPEKVDSFLWGNALRFLSLSRIMRKDLILSITLSILVVFVFTLLAFRSVKFGLFALIPLGSGVMISFILIVLAGIPLDMTTIMVFSIAIGVGVDDSIHFILRYREQKALTGGDRDAVISETLVVTGRPILLTSVSIVIGLVVLGFASFKPIAYFGYLVVFTLTATCVATLLFLPAVLRITRS